MNIYPVILDSRPAYLRGAGAAASLLLAPAGRGCLLEYLDDCLRMHVHERPRVLVTFEPHDQYEQQLHRLGAVSAVIAAERIAEALHQFEVSDLVLLVDPRCFPAGGLNLAPLLEDLANCRLARHLIPLQTSGDGAREYVLFDPDGDVRRIQRYFDGVTRLETSGVSCTLLSVAALHEVVDHPLHSLGELRCRLATRGIPSRDYTLGEGVLDLTEESGLLGLSERFTIDETGPGPELANPRAGGAYVLGDAQVARSARLLGPVIVQPGARVGENATIIGPTVVGPRASIERNAVLAQCLVLADAHVPRGAAFRQRVVSGGEPLAAAVAPRDELTLRPAYWDVPRVGAGAPLEEPRRVGGWYGPVKRGIDALLAGLGLLLLTPVFVVVALLNRLTSPGPVFFGHEREGRDGRVFRCWKFRTMVPNAHLLQRALYQQNNLDGPQFKLARDNRITPVGALLRATNIDELPQLINVLLGEMSLIGPRPSPFRENQICVPWRRARLSVRPGITGLWQICRHDRNFGDFHQWIYFDMLYVRHVSFWLDVKILVATLLTMGGRFSVPVTWLISRRRLQKDREVAWTPSRGPLIYHPHPDAVRSYAVEGSAN